MKISKSNIVSVVLLFCLVLTGVGCVNASKTSDEIEQQKDTVLIVVKLGELYRTDPFGKFLRSIPRKDKKEIVKDYYGQDAMMEEYKYCVLDFPLLSDKEQCADVCMHLRALYLFRQKKYDQIHFHDINGRDHAYKGGDSLASLKTYLRRIFMVSNTYSMYQEMDSVSSFHDMRPGDVFIIPADNGMLGHAIIILDVAKDKAGNLYFMVGQGYTPACDFHIICNNAEPKISPWFKLGTRSQTVNIAGYEFDESQLKRWKE